MRWSKNRNDRDFRNSMVLPWKGIMSLAVVLIAIFAFQSMKRERMSRSSDAETDEPVSPDVAAVRILTGDRALQRKLLPDDASFQEALSLVSDRTLEIKPREMAAYWKMIESVHGTSIDDRDLVDVRPIAIHEIFQHPVEHRGEVSTYDMMIHRVLEYDFDGHASGMPDKLYEVWGSAAHSKNWLFVLIATELPDGFNATNLLKRKASFAGYFFKLQGYHPIGGKSSDRPLLAPMFIGKIKPLNEVRPEVAVHALPLASYMFLGFSLLVFMVLLLSIGISRKHRKVVSASKSAAALQEVDMSLFDSAYSLEADGRVSSSDS